MKRKLRLNILILSALVLIPMVYNSCTGQHGEGTLSSLGGICDEPRREAFKTIYWPFVRQSNACGSCHTAGPGSGLFANGDVQVAYSAFIEKTEQKISEFAVSSHKAPLTGSQHQARVNTLRAQWAPIQAAYDSCISQAGGGGGPIGGGQLPVPDEFTIAKDYTIAQGGQSVTMRWNLGNEMQNAANSFDGATFEMILSANDLGNGQALYELRAPRLINTSPTSVVVVGVGAKVNGLMVSGGTAFYGVVRYVPNLQNNNSRQLGHSTGGAITFSAPLNTSLSIQAGFSDIDAAGFDFQPQTFQQLTNAGGIFQANCVQCHSVNGPDGNGPAGGFRLDANNGDLATYNQVVGAIGVSGRTLITKYSLENSHLWSRINNAGAPMPPTGLLPEDPARNRIRDWILDGAPRVNNDIRR